MRPAARRGQELAPRQRAAGPAVDQGRDLGRAQQRRVLADGREVGAGAEAGGVVAASAAVVSNAGASASTDVDVTMPVAVRRR